MTRQLAVLVATVSTALSGFEPVFLSCGRANNSDIVGLVSTECDGTSGRSNAVTFYSVGWQCQFFLCKC